MLKKSLHILSPLLLLLATAVACTDEIKLDQTVIGPGEAMVSASVDFHPLIVTDTEVGSRASQKGDLIKSIDDLTVFIYDIEGNLFRICKKADLADYQVKQKNETGSNTGMPNDAGGKPVQAEESTARATFTIAGLPFGQYRMYAVANIDFGDKAAAEETYAREETLRDYTVTWNSSNIGANNQMFGYFTIDGNDSNLSTGFTAPNITVNQKHTSLHAWIKRAASKVTVVYDGKGLHEGVFIYIKNITIKDIPRSCKIGNENKVENAEGMITDGGVINYCEATEGELPAGQTQSGNYEDWMMIANGTPTRGAVSVDKDGNRVEHSEYDGALYFYENCQGNYPDQPKYDKRQNWDQLGYVPQPGENEYKDNIPYGTYVEVDAYYVSNNPVNVSSGPIKYRFMLGQNITYDYDAIRNHHYKLTLGFKGWANQADWHIEYIEPPKEVYTDPTYYVSYSYNTQAIFPIRIKGDVQEFEVEIVENNWAPYSPSVIGGYNVPQAEVASSTGIEFDNFKWWREIYVNNTGRDFYYGLQKPWTVDGSKHTTYSAQELKDGAPSMVTPIWAGFLALNVEGNSPEDLKPYLLQDRSYSADYDDLKKYFYEHKQNYRKFSSEDLAFSWNEGDSIQKVVGTGNNKCTIFKAPDGSITINLPTWTRPKSMLGISGFTGNNPYDTYQRKAIVKLTATYKDSKIVKFMPIFQVRRVVNPKGVWRRYNDNEPFKVTLVRREAPGDAQFKAFNSEGAWRAYIDKTSDGDDGFFHLEGGIGKDNTGAIIGNTDTPIEFNVVFDRKGEAGRSKCGIVRIEYHGFTCQHTIFVRQGYFEPISIVDNGARWSSFNLFNCSNTSNKSQFGQTWKPSGNKPKKSDYIPAEVTASPIALSTLFKRGNYRQGISVENNRNSALGPLKAPGSTPFILMNSGSASWSNIDGYSYTENKGFAWGRFSAQVNNQTRYYKVPSWSDYNALISNGQYAIGVLYADGATETATDVNVAYGFYDINNDGKDDHNGTPTNSGGPSGMRGFIVYNPKNAHQIFFPIGAMGIGRRTVQLVNNTTFRGELRYGALSSPFNVLSNGKVSNNVYRPIPYNIPGAPGAIYWIDKAYYGTDPVTNKNMDMLGWDMNYFDMNFNQYDYAVSNTPDGDALPIKLILDLDGPWE